MASLKKGSFPGISRQGRQSATESAITENIEILTGQRGNGENRALLYKDLLNLDQMKRDALRNNAGGTNSGGLPIDTGGIERPHAPVNVTATGGFTFIAITWDAPTYRGHAYAEIWRNEIDSFSSATMIATQTADVHSDTVNMGSKYYYWVRFVNVIDVKGPIQGAAGIYAETQKSAELILDEIGGLIEESHLNDFLTSAIDKIPGLELSIENIIDFELPELKVKVDEYDLDISKLKTDVDDVLVEIPDIKTSLDEITLITEIAKTNANNAIEKVEAIEFDNDSLARQLIESALVNDQNWQNNTAKLFSFEAKLDDANARFESEFLTRTEANEAIAAAATTIQVMIEENGTSLSGDIENTYYTKATTDQAIAAATSALRSLIEDPEGNSVGATLSNDYYTSVETDSAISAYGLQLKSDIEDPEGNSIGALIKQDYSTTVDMEQAISQASTQLKSEIDNDLATITQSYYTASEVDSAITTSSELLKTEIEDPYGNSVGATLFNYYATKTDMESAVAEAIVKVGTDFELNFELLDPIAQAVIENALANDKLADLNTTVTAEIISDQKSLTSQTQAIASSVNAFETKFLNAESNIIEVKNSVSEVNKALSEKTEQLTSQVDENLAFLETNYLTKVDTESALSEATQQLSSSIGDLQSDIYENFSTLTTLEETVSQATTALKSEVDGEFQSANANLQNNYYTKAATDFALSQATTALKSEIENPEGNSLGATLYREFQTKADANAASASTDLQLDAVFEPSSLAIIENALANDIENTRRTVIEADFIEKQRVFASAQESLSQETKALESKFNDSEASIYEIQETITRDKEAAASEILKLNSDVDNVKADLVNNYFTSADTEEAIASADLALKSAIEDPEGNSVAANLQNNYYTKATANEAIAQRTEQLRAEIENPNGNGLGAFIYENYSTTVSVEQAISSATQILQSRIENPNGDSLGAFVANNYFTKVDTEQAISTASETLVSQIGENSSRVQTLSETVATNDGKFSALWGVKTSVNGLQSSIGLVNDGVEPIFAVKGAKFAVITDQDPTNLTPVFAVSDGKTVINTAIIDQAFIRNLVTDDLLANRLLVGSRLTTPSINYNPSNGARSSNFSIDPNGNMLAKSATLESVTIKDINGNIVMNSSGAINADAIEGLNYNDLSGKPTLGPFAGLSKILSSNVSTYIANGAIGSAQIDQAYINQLFGNNASFFGTVYAQNLDGDVIDLTTKNIGRITNSGSGEVEVARFSVSSQPFQRKIMIDGIRVSSNPSSNSNASSTTLNLYMSGYSSARDSVTEQTNLDTGDRISPILLATIPANSSRTVYVRISKGGTGEQVAALPQRIVARVFKDGSTIS
ncbi:hypothetical protein CWB59_12455 [Pseudoalteromonas sp. S326]|uniref:phage tail tip fiber protein n=1 Tax=Pseudoalteromonas sp. S326 TaxID=579533 RepID=UPI00110AC8AD|nr:DUF1983 domain-containing protein [Pseudoalteromonas sp. S326]TMO16725.1 hypothetical protein CWB59_12455 [Pseudoalteromonas sp. S326]